MSKSEFITIKAGPKAKEHIKKNGFHPREVKTIAAAAGGPKWFVIYHLTRYIGEHILPQIEERAQLLGSSVGGWQMACLATADPGAALERLRDSYAGEIYEDISRDSISRGCRNSLDQVFSDEDVDYIFKNEKVNLNIFAARGKGILRSNAKPAVYAGLAWNFITNAFSRKNVEWSFERNIFSSQLEMPIIPEQSILSTKLKELNASNYRDVLMATAAIPLVMNAVDYISNAPNEMFWDGGLTDYHMSLPYHQDGLVLIPHFLPEITKGWMDKSLKSRRATGKDMPNALVIHPSEKFVGPLPKGKITTRDDFMDYKDDQIARKEYWTTCSEMSKVMAEELDDLIRSGMMGDVLVDL